MADKEKLIDRVRKLLALAKDGAASQGEVQNALRFARKLMDEHNISEVDVEDVKKQGSTNVFEEDAVEKSELLAWELELTSVVMYVTEAKAIRQRVGARRFRITFVGVGQDAAIAADMYRLFMIGIRASAKMHGYQDSSGKRNQYRSYCTGFVRGLLNAARRAKAEAMADIRTSGLVVVKKGAIAKYVADRFGETTPHDSKSSEFDILAFLLGRSAGEKQNLGNYKKNITD